MKDINAGLRKMSKGFADKIREDSLHSVSNVSKRGVDYLEDSGVQPLTLKDQLIKGNDISVKFIGSGKDDSMKNIQLAVFINGSLKYVSKKDVFAITTLTFPAIKRKGWKVYCENEVKDRIIFKDKRDHEKFIGFCTQVRDCIRIQDMFNSLCYSFLRDFENEVLKEDVE